MNVKDVDLSNINVDRQAFSERLRGLLKENNLTFDKAGELLGVSNQNVDFWINKNGIPQTDILLKMSDVFGVSVDYLLGVTDAR